MGITLKTPIPALILGLFGMAGLVKGFRKSLEWEIVAAFLIPFTMMVSVMSSHINIGTRHILAIYPLFAVGATASAVYLMEHINETWKSQVKYSLIGLLVTQIIVVFMAYPNFIGYFNLLAGKTPAKIMLGADLDWGQGLIDISEYTKEHQINSLYISYYGVADNCMYDLPEMTPLPRNEPVKGWIAISETNYWGLRLFDETAFAIPDGCKPLIFSIYSEPKPHTFYRWLDDYQPEAILAGSIRLYHIE